MTSDSSHFTQRLENKLRMRCCKWLGYLHHAIPSFPSLDDLAAERDGFVVLNGGVLAGSSPSATREVLLETSVTSDARVDPANGQSYFYSSVVPFVVVRHTLDVAHPSLHALTVPSVKQKTTATTISDVESHDEEQRPVTVYALRTNRTLRTGNSGTSQSDGCGFYFLLPICAVDRVLEAWGSYQRPTLCVANPRSPPLYGNALCSRRTDPPNRVRLLTSTHLDEVPGLFYLRDFVTGVEEAAILQELQTSAGSSAAEYLSRRRVMHFNRRFIYGTNRVGAVGEGVRPHPSFYDWMLRRLGNNDPSVEISGPYPLSSVATTCDQLTVNYYSYAEKKCCGIAPHVDAHSSLGEYIAVVSLGSYTVMDFARWDSPKGQPPVGVFLAPRSLVVMSGEARYAWTHCIQEKRTDTLSERIPTQHRGDRVSLTWRRGRREEERHRLGDCMCPALCDAQQE